MRFVGDEIWNTKGELTWRRKSWFATIIPSLGQVVAEEVPRHWIRHPNHPDQLPLLVSQSVRVPIQMEAIRTGHKSTLPIHTVTDGGEQDTISRATSWQIWWRSRQGCELLADVRPQP